MIEILAVISIIAILAALTIGIASFATTRAATSRARGEIEAMQQALDLYKQDMGTFPYSSALRNSADFSAERTNSWYLYRALTVNPKKYYNSKPDQVQTMSGLTFFVDPFGNPYNYFRRTPPPTNQVNQISYDLWSYGPDGKNGTDDITNWSK